MASKDTAAALLSPLTSPVKAFLDDPIGTLQRGQDNGQRIPNTRTKTSFALTIHAIVGNRRGVIGGINRIAVRQSRTVEEEYEVESFARGLPRELIPQILSNRIVTLKRYELYKATIKQVFAAEYVPGGELLTLLDQTSPFTIRLSWSDPEPTDLGAIARNVPQRHVYEYMNCYFTDMGEEVSTTDVIVQADATMVWGNIRQLL